MDEQGKLQELADKLYGKIENLFDGGKYTEIKDVFKQCGTIRQFDDRINKLCILSEIDDVERKVGRQCIWKDNDSLDILRDRIERIINLFLSVVGNADEDSARELTSMVECDDFSIEGLDYTACNYIENSSDALSLIWSKLEESIYNHDPLNEPLVSVLILCYNHEKYVGEAIDSVMNQTYKNIEVIITDDGSTDNSKEVIKNKIEEWGDDRFIFISYDTNTCFACVDEAIKAARGKYIQMIGADDMIEPTKTALQVSFLEKEKSIYDLCFTWVKCIGNGAAPQYESTFNQISIARAGMLRILFDHNYLNAPSMLIRKEVFDELGGFDFSYRQLHDYDCWLRYLINRQLYVIPLKQTVYRSLDNSLSDAGNTPEGVARLLTECENILFEFMVNIPERTFAETFLDEASDSMTELDIKCMKLIYVLKTGKNEGFRGNVFMRLFYYYRGIEGFKRLLGEKYGIDRKEIHKIESELTGAAEAGRLKHMCFMYQAAAENH
ncbi:MAG: glycosyltransferase [Lachnospiraceae bacterium]|jgi:glycosyltransferase involved in cell wall biosynthesis|nr:glycosyltransferase [Lachnospiraceae bacterium]